MITGWCIVVIDAAPEVVSVRFLPGSDGPVSDAGPVRAIPVDVAVVSGWSPGVTVAPAPGPLRLPVAVLAVLGESPGETYGMLPVGRLGEVALVRDGHLAPESATLVLATPVNSFVVFGTHPVGRVLVRAGHAVLSTAGPSSHLPMWHVRTPSDDQIRGAQVYHSGERGLAQKPGYLGSLRGEIHVALICRVHAPSALARTRTVGLLFRREMLFPLSYEGDAIG